MIKLSIFVEVVYISSYFSFASCPLQYENKFYVVEN